MISYPWCLFRTHLDIKKMQYLLLRFIDYQARLEISGRALRKNRDSWRKEQRLCLCGCVAYVTSLSKQGGSAKPSDFVVVRIRALVPCQTIPLIAKLSCSPSTCRLAKKQCVDCDVGDKIKCKGSVVPLGISPSLLLMRDLPACCPQLSLIVALLVFQILVLFVIFSAAIIL